MHFNYDQMDTYNHKTDSFFPFQFIFLGYLISLFGVYLLVQLNFLGLFVILAGLFLSFSFTGIEVSISENRFREYLGVFKMKFGKWHKLPKVEYVTVFMDRTIQQMHVASISTTQANNDFKINLVITKTEHISIGTFIDKTVALDTGKQLAVGLKTKLLDYTSGEPVWVN